MRRRAARGIDLGGRHDVRILTPGRVVKRAPRDAARREADALKALAEAGVAPRLLRHDARHGRLAMEAIDGRTLAQRARDGRIPAGLGASLGRALAATHALPPPRHAAPLPLGVLLHRPRAEALDAASPGSLAIVHHVQATAPLADALEACRRAWRPDARIHGDVRPPNVLVARRRVVLVDWEGSGAGDAAWDVGSALGTLLGEWVLGMPLAPGLDVRQSASLSRVAWPRVAAEAQGAWRAYRDATRADEAFLQRAAAMAVARLAQTAYECAQRDLAPGAHALRLLQLAANLAPDPLPRLRAMLPLEAPP